MIYKLIFQDKTEYAQAKSHLHLLQSYQNEFSDFQEIQEVIEVSEDEAKKIILKNNEYDEDNPVEGIDEYFSLYDTVSGDDFVIVGSTEWD